MNSHETGPGRRLRPILQQREAELRATLRSVLAANSDPADSQQGVSDFKDIAAEQSRDTVDEAQADHAAIELEQVVAALQRIEDGSYGQCLDCGEPIDERRLTAMPAAAYCVACQAVHEHGHPH
jgi:DnaK suppressor protein